jgi:hypothetical protein
VLAWRMKRSHILLGVLVLAAGLAYLSAWAAADHPPGATPSGEGLMAPLDDAYIFGQYAAQALHGQWMHYTPGAPISTGVSSASWLILLTALMGLGWPLTWAAWALGLACLAWSAHSLVRLSRQLFPSLPDWLLPLLFLAHASSVSLYFQGMDSGLLLAALLACAEAALDPAAWKKFWALGTVLVFTRPEGQIAFPALALARAWPLPGRWRKGLLALSLAALPTLGLWALSGSAIPDSVVPKTIALDRLSVEEHRHVSLTYGARVAGHLLMGLVPSHERIGLVGDAEAGNDPSKHFPPLALALALAGLGAAGGQGRRRGWWLGLGAAWLATFGLLCWKLPVGWHRHRYLAPLWPLMLLGFAAALDALKGPALPRLAGRCALIALWLAFGLWTWPWFLRTAYQSGARYAVANREAAYALKALPDHGPVAVEDAGLIAYYSGRETVDLLGVTDHQMALAQKDGPAAVLAALQSRAAERRPATALLHPARTGSYSELWTAQGILRPAQPLGGMVLYRFNGSVFKRQP